jgi:tetratricopeptide (TPR) repeat protein
VGNFPEAIKWYRSYLELYPKDAEARLSYARALNWNGNFKEAEEEYLKVVEQHEMEKTF